MVHEPRTIRFIRQNMGQGDVVHAGTYFGDFIPAIAKAMHPGQKLWAFEPVPENYQCAQKTIALNELANVHLRNAGLGAFPQTVQMIVSDPQGRALGGGSRIAKQPASDRASVPIEIDAIDNVVPSDRSVSIIQLDVEGHELPALQGAWKTIQENWPILILEVLGKNNVLQDEWFIKHIRETGGYNVVGKVHENTVLARPEHNISKSLLQ